MATSTRESVPQKLRPLFEDLVGRTDAFCLQHLNEEYARYESREIQEEAFRLGLIPYVP